MQEYKDSFVDYEESNEELHEEDVKVGKKDMLAMTIACYQIVLPIVLLFGGVMALVAFILSIIY